MTGATATAFGKVREEAVEVCKGLSDDDWNKHSACDNWTVKDVLAHMATELTPQFTFASFRSGAIERTNDNMVDTWANLSGAQVLRRFDKASGMAQRVIPVGLRLLGFVPYKLAELGYYPLRTLVAAVVFDWHTHIRHDICGPLGPIDSPLDPPSQEVIATALSWMFTCVRMSCGKELDWLPGPITIELDGPGGGRFVVDLPSGRDRAEGRLATGNEKAIATIRGAAADFPAWATHRQPWNQTELDIDGDTDTANRFMDTIRIV